MSRAYEELEELAKSLEERIVDEALGLAKLGDELRKRLKPRRLKGRHGHRRVVGVDGSYAVYSEAGLTTLVVQAVAVDVAEGLVDRLGPLAFTLPTPSDTLEARVSAEELMSIIETLLLERLADACGDDTLIVVDGPLVDPPRPRVPESKLGLEALRRLGSGAEYHSWRARIVDRLASTCDVAFYVKRPWGARLIDGEHNDILVSKLALRDYEATEPKPLPPTLIPYTILSKREPVYSYTRFAGHPARIEMLPGSHAVEVLETLAALTPRGATYPLPVLAAHTLAKLTREDARQAHLLRLSKLSERLRGVLAKIILVEV